MLKCDKSLEDLFFGVSTVGERGQLVIPAEARKKLGINPGDKILVMDHPVAHGLVLFKIDAMREFVSSYMERLTQFEEALMASDNGDNGSASD